MRKKTEVRIISKFDCRKLHDLYKSLGNARLTLAKNQAKAKQRPEAELLLIENYSLCSSTLLMYKKQLRLLK